MSNVQSLKVWVLGAVVCGGALAAGALERLSLSQASYQYSCDGSVRVQVTHISTGSSKNPMPEFVVLHYKGGHYGLTQALSASGVRYGGLLGTSMTTGLDWWEKGEQARLSSFPSNAPDHTKSLLSCQMTH